MEVRMIRELIKSAVNLLKPSSSSSRVISNQSISSSKEYEYTKPGRKSIILDREKAKLLCVQSNYKLNSDLMSRLESSAYESKINIKPEKLSSIRLCATDLSQSDNENLSDLEVPSETKSSLYHPSKNEVKSINSASSSKFFNSANIPAKSISMTTASK